MAASDHETRIAEHYHVERRWRHKVRGTSYTEIGRGTLQASTGGHTAIEGDVLVAYRGDDGRLWFRRAAEFEDGRFEEITDGR